MQSIIIDGITRDLSHLKRVIIIIPGAGRDRKDLRVAVKFGLHTISRKPDPGEVSNMTDENGKARIFCPTRYTFSLGLSELAERLITQNYFCWQSSDRNRAINYAALDVAPGRIHQVRDGDHHMIYFYLYPNKSDECDVVLEITTCYRHNVALSKVKRRWNFHSLAKKCHFEDKRIP